MRKIPIYRGVKRNEKSELTKEYVIGHELKYKISCGIIAENNETASRREKFFSNPVPFFALYQPLDMGFYKINTRGTSL